MSEAIKQAQAFHRLAYNQEGHDCSVRAVAVACAAPYDVAHTAMAFAGRHSEGAASIRMIEDAVRALGFLLCPVVVKSRTLRALCRELTNEPGSYIAESATHVAGFWQGECIDWSRDTLTRIRKVYAVVKEVRQ